MVVVAALGYIRALLQRLDACVTLGHSESTLLNSYTAAVSPVCWPPAPPPPPRYPWLTMT